MKEIKKLYPENSKPITMDLRKRNLKDSDDIISKLQIYKETLINLDLSGNSLTTLSNLVNFNCLKYINITNNPINLERILPSLASINNLVDLKINLSSQDDVLAILTSLPNLTYLNGKPTKDETIDLEDKDILNISMNTEISSFNNTFNIINEKMKQINKSVTKDFFNEFQTILKVEIDKINQSVDNSVPNYIYATNVISSKLKLYKYFTGKYLDCLEVNNEESSTIVRDLFDKIKISTDTLVDIIYSLYPRIEEKTKSLKTNVEQTGKDNNLMNNELIIMEERLFSVIKEKDDNFQKFEIERRSYQEKIDTLEKENKMMTDKLIKNAKSVINENNSENSKNNFHLSPVKYQSNSHSNAGTISNNFHKNNISSMTDHNQHITRQSKNDNVLQFSQNGEMRIFTKKMLLDIIVEIYESKKQYDMVNIENKMPNETLEQHMYSYLNQKYGLKNLIIEWATTIINGLKTYSAEESDILLFGKILRNEIEENARFVLEKLKLTIIELLEHFIKTKNLLRPREEIKEELKMKMNGVILEEEWKGIIYYIYESEDATFIENKIIDYIKKKFNDKKNKDKEIFTKLSREEFIKMANNKEEFKIAYKEFQKILLDFQIKSREKYIKNFLNLFKKVDTDINGIISEEEFIRLTMSMNVYNSNINENIMRLLNIIDPANNKQITFSDCIKLFSNEILVQDDGDGNRITVNILDKICIDENDS